MKQNQQVRELLDEARTIAVVGLSAKPDRPSFQVACYMQEQGYRIIPVNPGLKECLGEKAYNSLKDIPGPVDIVDIFRRSEDVPPVVEDAVAIKAKAVWMQSGIINQKAAAMAESAGLKVVMDRCIMVEHRNLKD